MKGETLTAFCFQFFGLGTMLFATENSVYWVSWAMFTLATILFFAGVNLNE